MSAQLSRIRAKLHFPDVTSNILTSKILTSRGTFPTSLPPEFLHAHCTRGYRDLKPRPQGPGRRPGASGPGLQAAGIGRVPSLANLGQHRATLGQPRPTSAGVGWPMHQHRLAHAILARNVCRDLGGLPSRPSHRTAMDGGGLALQQKICLPRPHAQIQCCPKHSPPPSVTPLPATLL